jgi:hypothetical protein
MKNDYSFKLVAAIVFAGVVVAFFSPIHASRPVETAATPEVVQTSSHTE